MFAPVEKTTVATKVAHALREAVLQGRLAAGDTLPSERALAAQFNVNRSSVREALLRLEGWGLITIRQGEATRVRDVYEVGGLQLLPYLLMPGGQLDGALLGDILSIRVMFLRWTGQWAAERASKNDEALAELRATIEALEKADDDEARLRLDWRFFEQLVALTENRVLRLFVNGLRAIYLRNPGPLRALYTQRPFDTGEHRSAVEAISKGDAEGAATAMERYGRRALGQTE